METGKCLYTFRKSLYINVQECVFKHFCIQLKNMEAFSLIFVKKEYEKLNKDYYLNKMLKNLFFKFYIYLTLNFSNITPKNIILFN